MRRRLPPEVSIHSAWVTTPSPGETISPGPVGILRSGSRKNQRKNSASSTGSEVSGTDWVSSHRSVATTPIPNA